MPGLMKCVPMSLSLCRPYHPFRCAPRCDSTCVVPGVQCGHLPLERAIRWVCAESVLTWRVRQSHWTRENGLDPCVGGHPDVGNRYRRYRRKCGSRILRTDFPSPPTIVLPGPPPSDSRQTLNPLAGTDDLDTFLTNVIFGKTCPRRDNFPVLGFTGTSENLSICIVINPVSEPILERRCM